MREIDAKQITETVAQMCKEAAYYLPDDVYNAMKKARETEYGTLHLKHSEGYGTSREKYEYDELAGMAAEKGITIWEIRENAGK